ncbi:MAG: DUF4832 domain-containing protein, partial [Candidatus Hydrogenedentes bacterium]|nr:DUF4832 domain-containing protein [Candidatus Hydrogenedentota bacterium]
CVELTHASWLVSWNVDKGMFGSRQSEARIRKASQIVRRMGYDFHVAEADIVADDAGLQLKLRVRNLGVAPFYYDWPMEIAAFDQKNFQLPQDSLAATWRVPWKITGILPGEPDRLWEHTIARPDLPPGQYRLLLRVVNPLPSGKPLRFANATQDADRPGWLTIGSFDWAKQNYGEAETAPKRRETARGQP